MFRSARRLAAMFALAACASASNPALATERIDEGAVVVLAAGPKYDGVGAGTIVAVSGTYVRILTANHVATYGTLTIRFGDGSTAPGTLVVALPERDLAIVEADVPAGLRAALHAAPIALPHASDVVHVWGSGLDGPALEPAAVTSVGAQLPDGDARGRYTLACTLCHEGDSGGGVFDRSGRLVGVYIGYFGDAPSARTSVAVIPSEAVALANAIAFPTTLASAP